MITQQYAMTIALDGGVYHHLPIEDSEASLDEVAQAYGEWLAGREWIYVEHSAEVRHVIPTSRIRCVTIERV